MKITLRIAFGIVGLAGSVLTAQTTPRKALPPVYGVNVYCTLPGKGAMGVGWTEPYEGKYYRCLEVFDENLEPAGASWVQVEKGGTLGAQLPR